MTAIESQLIDIKNRAIYPAKITIKAGKIHAIKRLKTTESTTYILPGFVDAHVHIESSMLTPTEFAKQAVVHGTVATVSDPHEIANVLGKAGVWYMVESGQRSPFKFHFGAPSCVPATDFETAGAVISPDDVAELLASDDIYYLAEMMNYPGVLFNDPSVLAKLEAAKRAGKPIDGHAPGLMGDDALKYISHGISTDHECYKLEEAAHKLKNGMKVLIREGSAAKNFDTLEPLMTFWFDKMMFCSDDKHPDDLMIGHINLLVKRALAKGNDLFNVLQMACLNPVNHYNLPVGTLQMGDNADFIEVNNLTDFTVLKTFINGTLVAENGQSLIKTKREKIVNNFNCALKQPSDFELILNKKAVNVIEVLDGQLITNKIKGAIKLDKHQKATPSVGTSRSLREKKDILKIVVVNRYANTPPAVAFIKGFGLKKGALGSTVAHDSHNIIAVGVTDKAICKVVNALIKKKGGLAAFDGQTTAILPLPIAGLMSPDSCEVVAKQYESLVGMTKQMGSTLGSPFMSLSFMALLVIPSLKLSDKGLFDGSTFQFCSVEA
jgi:adenine deaminase